MTPEKFATLVNEFRERGDALLLAKRGDYSSQGDVLENFKTIAGFLGVRPSQIAVTYMLKHVQAVAVAVERGSFAWDWSGPSGEGLKQRLLDIVNYVYLLAGCIEDELGPGGREADIRAVETGLAMACRACCGPDKPCDGCEITAAEEALKRLRCQWHTDANPKRCLLQIEEGRGECGRYAPEEGGKEA